MRLSLSPTYYWQQVYSLEEEFDETSRRASEDGPIVDEYFVLQLRKMRLD